MAWWWEKIDVILLQQKAMQDDVIRLQVDVNKICNTTAQLAIDTNAILANTDEILEILKSAQGNAQRASKVNVKLGKPTDNK